MIQPGKTDLNNGELWVVGQCCLKFQADEKGHCIFCGRLLKDSVEKTESCPPPEATAPKKMPVEVQLPLFPDYR